MNAAGEIECVFQAWLAPPDDVAHLGHGLCILDDQRPENDQIIAFVDGYAWLHGKSSRATVLVREPDACTAPEIIADMKARLSRGLGRRDFSFLELTPRLKIHANA